MIAFLASLLIVILSIALFRWVMNVPLMRTLSCSIDQWADDVQGLDADQPR